MRMASTNRDNWSNVIFLVDRRTRALGGGEIKATTLVARCSQEVKSELGSGDLVKGWEDGRKDGDYELIRRKGTKFSDLNLARWKMQGC